MCACWACMRSVRAGAVAAVAGNERLGWRHAGQGVGPLTAAGQSCCAPPNTQGGTYTPMAIRAMGGGEMLALDRAAV